MADIAHDHRQERVVQTRAYMNAQDIAAAVSSANVARRALNAVAEQLRPGVRESALREFAKNTFAAMGLRTWHAPYIRFAEHTLLIFSDKTQEDFTLKDDDIAFIDFGIVHNGVEGDIGQTYVLGENPTYRHLKNAAMNIFKGAEEYWDRTQCNGIEIYHHIISIAERMDVRFNLDPAGHLIGAFPHRGWKEGLNNFPEAVVPGTWILEIQVRHPTLPFGAFYEDLLLKNYVKEVDI